MTKTKSKETQPTALLLIDESEIQLETIERLKKSLSPRCLFSTVVLPSKENTESPGYIQNIPVTWVKGKTELKQGQVFKPLEGLSLRYEKGKLIPSKEDTSNALQTFLEDIIKDEKDKKVGLWVSPYAEESILPLIQEERDSYLLMISQQDHPFGIAEENIGPMMERFIRGELPAATSEEALEKAYAPHMETLFQRIFQHTHHDFTQYKRKTLYRRIYRRISYLNLKGIHPYLELLEKDSTEVQNLYQEFLIGVTRFFRDKETFDFLRMEWLPRFIKQWDSNEIRVWIPACSSGEEAYSWAILFKYYRDKEFPGLRIRIFGSDIDQKALEIAREGLYPHSIENDVPPEMIGNSFIKERQGYRVRKELRDMIVFADQDLIHDPPYSRVHLISCRNLLIYLNKDLQEKVLTLFHYALLPQGSLLLGNSETLGTSSNLFLESNKKIKLFSKVENKNTNGAVWNMSYGYQMKKKDSQLLSKPQLDLKSLTESTLLKEYTPTAVMINHNADILYVQGKAGHYLEFSTGEVTYNIIRNAREGLKIALANAVRKVKLNNEEIVHSGLKVNNDGGLEYIDLIVTPMNEQAQGLIMVVFKPSSIIAKDESAETRNNHSTILELEKELSATQEYLQSTIEELETTNEELKSSNEEAQSTNEELQSANEELETSREELQSVNEELLTTNRELENKLEELNIANNDMSNLLASTQIATIFLDKEMKINRFTPSIRSIVDLLDSDIGRVFSQFSTKLDDSDLLKDAQKVLESLIPVEREVKADKDLFFWMRIVPYRTNEDSIEGIVITFTDITEKKKQEEELHQYREHLEELVEQKTGALAESEEKYRALYDNAPLAYQSLNPEGIILDVNPAWLKILGYKREEVIGNPFSDFLGDETKQVFQERFPQFLQRGYTHDQELVLKKRNSLPITVAFEGSIGYDQNRQPLQTYCTFKDITESKKNEQELIKSEEKYRLLVENQTDLIVKVDKNERFLFVSQSYCRTFGKTEEELLGQSFMPLVHEDDRESTAIALETLNEPPYVCYLEQRAKTVRGWRWFSWMDKAILNKQGQIEEILGIGRDITERMNTKLALEQSEQRYRMISSISTDFSYSLKLDKKNKKHLEWTFGAFEKLTGYNSEDFWSHNNILDRFHKEDHQALKEHWNHLLEGENSSIDARLITSRGDTLWIRSICQPETDERGNTIRILGMGKDISEQKKYEEALTTRNQELNQSLGNLQETQNMLIHQERLAAVGQFSAGIAHDFNNILTGVLGTAELLRMDSKLSESQKDHVETILQSGDRAANLVRQIMDYSRKSIRKEQPLDLRKTLKESLRIIRSGITEQYHIISRTDNYDGTPVTADQTQIEQLIINLIMNARDAIIGSGEIRITLRNRQIETDETCIVCNDPIVGDFVELSVEDNGVGMKDEIIKSIFEPFFTTKGIGKGSGLGLAQVYGIMIQYQGHIQLKSQPGKGTKISVFFPV